MCTHVDDAPAFRRTSQSHCATPLASPATEALLSKGARADAVDRAGRTPLHVAAGAGALPVLEALLRADPATAAGSAAAAPGGQPLHAVARSAAEAPAKLACISRLVAAGAKLSAVVRVGMGWNGHI